MKQKKCRTAGWRKKKIGIITSLSLILCICVGYLYIRFTEGYRTFRAPEHEAGIAEGIPSEENVQHYEELPVREGYVVGIDATPVYSDGRLYLNIANLKGNTVWFLVRVYMEDELIAESGIFYPDEYVEAVACSRELSTDDKVLIKVLAYEPDTYHSEGVAQILAVVTAE